MGENTAVRKSGGVNWNRVLLGLLMGFIEFWMFWAALAFAIRNGWLAPSEWYDGPVVWVLLLSPVAFWIARNARAFRRSGNKTLVKLWHGVIYLSSMPAGFALTLFVMRELF